MPIVLGVEIPLSVSDLIRRARGCSDISRRELAVRSGIPVAKVTRFESGQDPTADEWEQLCVALPALKIIIDRIAHNNSTRSDDDA